MEEKCRKKRIDTEKEKHFLDKNLNITSEYYLLNVTNSSGEGSSIKEQISQGKNKLGSEHK